MSEDRAEVNRGLAGVTADSTSISAIDPGTGNLIYRGYPVPDLAAHCHFEEVAYLIWHGELPHEKQLEDLTASQRSQRRLPPVLTEVLDRLPVGAHPMDVLRTAVSVLGTLGLGTPDGPSSADAPMGGGAAGPGAQSPAPTQEAELKEAVSLWSKLPTIVAGEQRRRRGQPPIPPDPELSFAENFFHMCFGQVPPPEVVHGFEVALVLYAEHGFNASTFAARVITSTLSDLYSAVTGAIGALKGPLHGGANEAVMAMFSGLGTPEEARQWLAGALAAKEKIMGFGHRVYKHGDSRVPTMYAALQALADASEEGQRALAVYHAIEQMMADSKGLYPNLDYPAGPAFHLMGFDTPTFTPIFVMSRVVGWTAHIIEQRANNALVRPLSAYTGHPRRELPATV